MWFYLYVMLHNLPIRFVLKVRLILLYISSALKIFPRRKNTSKSRVSHHNEERLMLMILPVATVPVVAGQVTVDYMITNRGRYIYKTFLPNSETFFSFLQLERKDFTYISNLWISGLVQNIHPRQKSYFTIFHTNLDIFPECQQLNI